MIWKEKKTIPPPENLTPITKFPAFKEKNDDKKHEVEDHTSLKKQW